MGMTATQKIMAAHAGLSEVSVGQLIESKLDIVMENDITIPSAAKEMVKAADTVFIFYRNALNIGLPILERPEAAENIAQGDEISVDFDSEVIIDKSTGQEFRAEPIPVFMQKLIDSGGLMNYCKQKLR